MKCSLATAPEILPSDLPLLGQGLPPVYQDDEDEEEEEEEEDDDFDLLDEDALSEMLSDYDEPLMKVEVFMELVDTLEEKLKVKDNKGLHISALQSLVVYILTAEELATEDFAIASSSPTKAASLFKSLSSRLDQLKQTYLPQAVAFDHYVGEAWKVIPDKSYPRLYKSEPSSRRHQFLQSPRVFMLINLGLLEAARLYVLHAERIFFYTLG